ncbi:MAG: alpha-amylase family glycosyl hydrolase [Calditrichia bacterium]
MPIFPIGEKGRKGTLGSPYSVRDFRAVNPEYGTKKDFRGLVKAIHQRGMKVILGIVPNHSSNDNVLMKEHPDWFMQDEKGQFTREVEDWSDVTDFNYDNPAMREYMTETFLYWVKEFDIDGYRCDVAGMVPYDFWKETIRRLKEVKPDIYMLAEWEDPKIILAGFNSDYDWTLYHLLKEVRKSEKRTAEAVTLIDQKDSRYPRNSLPMRFLENHDEQRSMQEFGPEAIEAYATFIFTAPGIPLIYAGQEIGETQKPSLFEKSMLDWAGADTALQNMYRSLIDLRKQYSCLTEGKFIPLQIASYSGSAGAFLREDDSTAAVVVFNLQNKTARKVIVTTSKEVRDRLRGIVFKNYRNAGDTKTFEKIYFKELLPYQALVYTAKKQ